MAAAAAVLTRPEGALYVAPLAAGLVWTRRRALWGALRSLARGRVPGGDGAGPILALVCCAAPVAAFSLFLVWQLGIVWPAGWGNVAGPRFVVPNVRLVVRQDLPQYAAVAGLPAPRVSGPALAALAGALAVAGLVRLWRTWPALRFVPVALALNLAVIFSSPTYLTLDLFSPATFFRHLSVLFPWLVPALAVLLPRRLPSRGAAAIGSVGAALAALALVAELAVLASATTRNQTGRPTILTSDPYVLVSDLWRAADGLPELPFTRGDGGPTSGAAAVDPAFDYLGFRARLFAAVRPYDQHVDDAGRAYLLASGVVALAGLAAIAVAGLPIAPSRPGGRDRGRDTAGYANARRSRTRARQSSQR